MRTIQYHDGELDFDQSTMVAYLWNMEYENLKERCDDDMTFDDFENVLWRHIMGSVVSLLMKNDKNCDLVNDLYKNMTGKGAWEDEEKEEMQPHCYRCNNMNMNLNVVCEECDKIFCKSHSYCVLGDNDMHYCSRECFINK